MLKMSLAKIFAVDQISGLKLFVIGMTGIVTEMTKHFTLMTQH